MKLEGTKEFEAPREIVWSVINDPSKMAKTMPGVESFEIADDTHWSAKVKVPLGLGGLKMSIQFEKLEERPPEFASLILEIVRNAYLNGETIRLDAGLRMMPH